MGFFNDFAKNLFKRRVLTSKISPSPFDVTVATNPILSTTLAIAETLAEKKAKYDDDLRAEGFQKGYRQGNIDAAKKFASYLEQNDNFRIGAFAVGYHVARLGGSSNDKIGVIVDALGEPDSPILSDYIRSENNKIISNKPEFAEICIKYLNSLNTEQLKSIDNFIRIIINVGGSSASELNFFNNLWKHYLKQRGFDTPSIF